MKVQDFAYNVARKTMEYLEREQHYKIPEDTRKEVLKHVAESLNEIIKESN